MSARDFTNPIGTILPAPEVISQETVRELGYWSPLVLANNPGVGDVEFIVTDNDAPIIVWVPTS